MKKSLLVLSLWVVGQGSLSAEPIKPEYATNLVNAIYRAEGGAKAAYPYGIIAPRKLSEAEARRWCFNTVRNNWTRWEAARSRRGNEAGPLLTSGATPDYLAFLAARYAPIGAANDPRNLNRNWLKNVRAGLK